MEINMKKLTSIAVVFILFLLVGSRTIFSQAEEQKKNPTKEETVAFINKMMYQQGHSINFNLNGCIAEFEFVEGTFRGYKNRFDFNNILEFRTLKTYAWTELHFYGRIEWISKKGKIEIKNRFELNFQTDFERILKAFTHLWNLCKTDNNDPF
jgi:hypothetical protein